MASINKVILVARTGKDAEIRYTADGAAITNASMATTRRYKDAGGAQQEETEWHRVCFFGRLAEIAGEYLRKGKLVYVEGRLRTRKWQDKDGQDRYTTEIVAENLQLLGSRSDESASSGEPRPERAGTGTDKPASAQQGKPAPAARSGAGVAAMTDDIPFMRLNPKGW